MKKVVVAVFTALLISPFFASAQEDNSEEFSKWQVRLRAINIMPNESANIGVIGGDVDISNAFVPELDFTYFINKKFALELILGTAKHDVNTVGSDISAVGGSTNANVDLGDVWLLPPTLTFQYHHELFKNFKPYVGAGINYTIFYNEDAGGVAKGISYDNSFGIATQIGFDYMINEKFFLNADFKYIFLSTDVTVDADNMLPGLSIPAEVDINPAIAGFGIGMKF
ncbi:OmpW/AlkL family protein [Psychroflexus sp. ALD_RP9]|uniref:OmpW/AlkL family protein n=1 Tax=Psychroflexus sp. ALD_RP9 TaxID=2777186 RepID=UPI001A8C94BA|nr:OmpW family outer membrane protein [Psychroflexus sp. ALD_RP9]QSS97031.1 OmpW family protein [Psychroflexus sp. ALD_RP9]